MLHPRTLIVLMSSALLAPASLAQGPLVLSVTDNVDTNLPSFGPFTDEDAVRTNFDGSGAGIEFSIDSGDLDAMHRLPNGNWLVSSLFNGSFGGTAFDDGDLVEIDVANGVVVGTPLAESDFDQSGADITGVSILPNGNWLLSTLGDNSLGGTAFTDGDIVEYNPLSGAASIFLSEADLFDDGDGDVYGIHAFDDGRLLLTTNVDEVISGTTFRDGDAFFYDPATNTATLAFSEDLFSTSGANSFDIDALYVIPTPGAATLLAFAGLAGVRRRRA
jgi:hypothetical protein